MCRLQVEVAYTAANIARTILTGVQQRGVPLSMRRIHGSAYFQVDAEGDPKKAIADIERLLRAQGILPAVKEVV